MTTWRGTERTKEHFSGMLHSLTRKLWWRKSVTIVMNLKIDVILAQPLFLENKDSKDMTRMVEVFNIQRWNCPFLTFCIGISGICHWRYQNGTSKRCMSGDYLILHLSCIIGDWGCGRFYTGGLFRWLSPLLLEIKTSFVLASWCKFSKMQPLLRQRSILSQCFRPVTMMGGQPRFGTEHPAITQ